MSIGGHGPRGGTEPVTAHERWAAGRALRKSVPRASHDEFTPAARRPDPVAQLEAQATDRLPDLLPVRYGRMAVSPFAFLRGSATVMNTDLACTPTTGLSVQLCGDAHLANFGVFASPERTLVFDVNDFDETLPGPWEWDVKRLAASFVVAGRVASLTEAQCRRIAIAATRMYRQRITAYAGMRHLDVWYDHIGVDEVLSALTAAKERRGVRRIAAKARGKDHLRAYRKLTTTLDGQVRIVDDPPIVDHVDVPDDVLHQSRAQLLRSLPPDRRHLLARYTFVDAARKVVGVGSVGTRCYIVLLIGRDDDDPLFLQVKQAQHSVLEPHLRRSKYANQGQRVVAGQQLMQSASDMFLGWTRATDGDFYWRQLWDMKGSVTLEGASTEDTELYATVCGAALARAHARSGDPIAIAGYLGNSGVFEEAVADFAAAYADQNQRDYAALLDAIRVGAVPASHAV
ncbi:MAG: hypothetical protein QOH52_1332 [Pseudonocardiales bacterium]|nr:hypothetical protein [Pseudonocardiales bacterium]